MLDIVKKDIKISIQNLERINLLPTFCTRKQETSTALKSNL